MGMPFLVSWYWLAIQLCLLSSRSQPGTYLSLGKTDRVSNMPLVRLVRHSPEKRGRSGLIHMTWRRECIV